MEAMPINPIDSDFYKGLTAFMCDPENGAPAEKNAEIKEHMSRPDVALATHQWLMGRDLSDFDPNGIHQMPPKIVGLLHKHFPTHPASGVHVQRSTHCCTINSASNSGMFRLKGRLLDDKRVISLEELGEKDMKVFVKGSVQTTATYTHRKIHTVFLRADDSPCTKIDLCDFFVWCKCSWVMKSPKTRVYDETLHLACIETPFGRAVLAVQLMCQAENCEVDILDGNKTVQIQIKRKDGFDGPITVGIGLHTPNVCIKCNISNSDTVKLRLCSRCFKFDRIKRFYCSRECQKLDYPRHSHVCTYDWFSSDWREDAPRPVK
jgi:hypothetical protein